MPSAQITSHPILHTHISTVGFYKSSVRVSISADFEKGFIRAETVAYNDYVAAGSFAAAKEKGQLRLEGKEYIVNEGDIMTFRFAN